MKLNKLWAGAMALFALTACNKELEPSSRDLQPELPGNGNVEYVEATLQMATSSGLRAVYGLKPGDDMGATNGKLIMSGKNLRLRVAVKDVATGKMIYQNLDFSATSNNQMVYRGQIALPPTSGTSTNFQISAIVLSEVNAEGKVTESEKVFAKVSASNEAEVEVVNPTSSLVLADTGAQQVEANIPYMSPWQGLKIVDNVAQLTKLQFSPQGTLLRMRVVNAIAGSDRSLESVTFTTNAFTRSGKFTFAEELDGKPKFLTSDNPNVNTFTYSFPSSSVAPKPNAGVSGKSKWFYTWVMPTGLNRVSTTVDLASSPTYKVNGIFSTTHRLPYGSVPMSLIIKPSTKAPFEGIFEIEKEWGVGEENAPELPIPLEYVSDYNLATATSFAKTHQNSTTAYLRLNKADIMAQFNKTVNIEGKDYHLPTGDEWKAIFFGGKTGWNAQPFTVTEFIQYGGVIREYTGYFKPGVDLGAPTLGKTSYAIKLAGQGDRYRVAYRYVVMKNPVRNQVEVTHDYQDRYLEVWSRYLGSDTEDRTITIDDVATEDFWGLGSGAEIVTTPIVKRYFPFDVWTSKAAVTVLMHTADPQLDPADTQWINTIVYSDHSGKAQIGGDPKTGETMVRLFKNKP